MAFDLRRKAVTVKFLTRQLEQGGPEEPCGICGRPLAPDEGYGPYSTARSLGKVCGECAPTVTTGVV